MSVKILGVRWFSGRSLVGVVQVVPEHLVGTFAETKDPECFQYYIGVADGFSEEVDKQYIADWGTTLPKYVGDVMFNVKT